MTIIKTIDARPRQRSKQQQSSSNESCSSDTSSISMHRRTSSFLIRRVSDDDDDSNRTNGVTPSTINVVDPFQIMPWVHNVSSGSNSLSQENEIACHLPQRSTPKVESECNCLDDEDTLPALELIRELSFSPPPTPPRPHETETKKRADTADTEDTSHEEPRSRSQSPLLGLQYLPDHGGWEHRYIQ